MEASVRNPTSTYRWILIVLEVNIPVGNFAMDTWVTLSGGTAWAINFEGIIYRTGTADPGGTMITSKPSRKQDISTF